jgi:hypothetical protein
VLGLVLMLAGAIATVDAAPGTQPAGPAHIAAPGRLAGPQIGAPAPGARPVLLGVDSSNPIYWVFNNKTRMVQVATVAMAIGLFIMMRK